MANFSSRRSCVLNGGATRTIVSGWCRAFQPLFFVIGMWASSSSRPYKFHFLNSNVEIDDFKFDWTDLDR